MSPVDGRAPCVVGVTTRTWHPGPGGPDAPEPLDQWEEVALGAAADSGGAGVLGAIDSARLVYCQTWQYDDPVGRLCERLAIDPAHRRYSGIGGTVPQQLVADAAEGIVAGHHDLVLVAGAEALATRRARKRQGRSTALSHPPEQRPPFPWEAPFHPAEVAHDVFQAWLTFAVFESARRARLGADLDRYRLGIGRLLAPMTEVAAANPEAWFRVARGAEELVTPTAENRMVGYPYTKYTVSVMDVDMAAAVLVASHERADALGIPADRRVYLRGWSYATDPTYVAEHPDLSRSPAMAAAAAEALAGAGVGIDDVAHLDLYSCFASSVHFACDALGLDVDDPRPLTVTGGLPYHGGAGSDYLTHSIAAMVRTLRADPGSTGLVSGVGMHMTKHAYACYSTEPGPLRAAAPDRAQDEADRAGRVDVVDRHEGEATVAAYSVVHDRDGEPDWGLLVCDVPGGRAYAGLADPAALATAERDELVGATVHLAPTPVALATGGDGVRHDATVVASG